MLLILLLILFQIKHFLADFPLQTPYMLGKFKDKGWVLPLTAHSMVHSLFTFLIVVFIVDPKSAVLLGLLDFTIHFIMDRIKASPKLLGRFTAISKKEFIAGDYDEKSLKSNKLFWWSLGLDQMVHHITHYIIIIITLSI